MHLDQVTPSLAWAERLRWLDGCDLTVEWDQARAEGRELGNLEDRFRELLRRQDELLDASGAARWDFRQQVLALTDAVQRCPLNSGAAAAEPSDWSALAALQTAPEDPPCVPVEDLDERLAGALTGRIVGCLLGKPVETWSRAQIQEWARFSGNSDLAHYWELPAAEDWQRLSPGHPLREAARRKAVESMTLPGIQGMPEDDDINYTVIGWRVVERHGPDFATEDVGESWLQEVPLLHTCTAERAAYRNLAAGLVPPASATHRNPYRELIGAQIRGDFFGWCQIGRPRLAAEWAYRDAALSHTANGIYGEMWVAALLALAPAAPHWPEALFRSLAYVPPSCRLARELREILVAYGGGQNWAEAVEGIHRRWDETTFYGWCHTIPNAAVVAAALLHGGDDFTRTIGLAVRSGFDTDCNGATCGSLLGLRNGSASIPSHWVEPLRDQLQTGVASHREVGIRALTAEMTATVRRLGSQSPPSRCASRSM